MREGASPGRPRPGPPVRHHLAARPAPPPPLGAPGAPSAIRGRRRLASALPFSAWLWAGLDGRGPGRRSCAVADRRVRRDGTDVPSRRSPWADDDRRGVGFTTVAAARCRTALTTATTLACRNSTDPACGPFRWDPRLRAEPAADGHHHLDAAYIRREPGTHVLEAGSRRSLVLGRLSGLR